MENWLIEKFTLEFIINNFDKAEQLSNEDLHAFFISTIEEKSEEKPYNLIDGKAEIDITGVLTNRPNFAAFLFGGGNRIYQGIRNAVVQADEDEEVKEIVLNITSPGGQVAGLFDTAKIIADAKKPVTAMVNEYAYSAAYALASQADKIILNNDAAQVGSIGIVQQFFVDDEIKMITSTDAPKKAPDVSTKKGENVVKAQLDKLHEKFAGLVANGRTKATGETFSTNRVNNDFGEGGVVIAEDALKAGMIDGIEQFTVLNPGGDGASGAYKITVEDSGNLDEFLAVVTGFDDQAEIIDETWDQAAADKVVRKHTGSTDKPDNSGSKTKQYRDYFSWYDTKQKDLFGGYKLQIATVKNGNKVINIRAVRNALARLPQTKGIPASEQDRIRVTLRKYVDKNQKQKKGEGKKMDLQTLKSEHPELHNQITQEAVNKGIEAGVKQERDRVEAHLKMAEGSGALVFALDCIVNGTPLSDQSVQAEYMSYAMKHKELDDQAGDNAEENDTEDTATGDEETSVDTMVDKVLSYSKKKGQTKTA